MSIVENTSNQVPIFASEQSNNPVQSSLVDPRESSLATQIYDFVVRLFQEIASFFSSCFGAEISQLPQGTTNTLPPSQTNLNPPPQTTNQSTNTQPPSQGTTNETIEEPQEILLDENQDRGTGENEIISLGSYTFSMSPHFEIIKCELGKLLTIPGKKYSNTWEMGLASSITHARSMNPFAETTAFKKQEGSVQTLTFFFKGEKFDGSPMLQYLSYGSVLTQNWGLSNYSYCEEKQQNIYRFTVDIAKVFTPDPQGIEQVQNFPHQHGSDSTVLSVPLENMIRLSDGSYNERVAFGLRNIIVGMSKEPNSDVYFQSKDENDKRHITVVSQGQQKNILWSMVPKLLEALRSWGIEYFYCQEKQQNIYRLSHALPQEEEVDLNFGLSD